MAHPQLIEWNAKTKDEPIERIVADYIAGMTDRFAIQDYLNKFVPRSWGKKQEF
jgi:dGTPase